VDEVRRKSGSLLGHAHFGVIAGEDQADALHHCIYNHRSTLAIRLANWKTWKERNKQQPRVTELRRNN
jgi:hypothetical protein